MRSMFGDVLVALGLVAIVVALWFWSIVLGVVVAGVVLVVLGASFSPDGDT